MKRPVNVRAYGNGLHLQWGFSLIEMMIALVILLILGMLLMPSFSKVASNYKLRDETSQVEGLIRKTMAAGIAESTNSRVTIIGGTITGFLLQDNLPIELMSHELDQKFAFTRSNTEPTPWLGNGAVTSLNYADGIATNGQLDFTRFGLPLQGAAIFLENKDVSTVIEILASGQIKTYHWEDESWSK